MYDVTWFIDDTEHLERYDVDQEIQAKERYKELVESRKCKWVQVSKLIDNWTLDDI